MTTRTDQELIAWAEGIVKRYGASVAQLLGIDPRHVVFNIVDMKYAGETVGTTISLDRDWYTDNPDDVGGVLHELVHAYLAGSDYTDENDWLHEGIADYVRVALGFPADAFTGKGEPKEGYAATASFLAWLEYTNPGSVSNLAQSLADRSYRQNEFRAVTGSSLKSLVDQYQSMKINPATGGPWYPTASPTGDGEGGDFENPPDTTTGEDAGASRQTFLAILQGWGLDMTSGLQQLVSEALDNDYSQSEFVYFLRQTPEYNAAFPGIFDEDGRLQMSEAQYFAQTQQYQDIAAQAGLNLGAGMTAYLFKNDVSPSEFQVKAPAVRQLKSNPELYAQFAKEIERRTGEVVDKQGLLKFAMGTGNAEWYNIWNAASARYAATQAGIKIAKASGLYTALSRQEILGIAKKGFSPQELSSGFQNVAQQLIDVLPEASIMKYGLSKEDILTATFGGKNQAAIRRKIQRITEQEEAFYQAGASSTAEETVGTSGQQSRGGTAQ